jgi:Flp pilus assembly protein TadG
MKLLNKIPVLGRLIEEDKGQALVFTAVILTALVGVMGVGVDAGKGYYAFELLKASTSAAALAGAAGLPNTATASSYAQKYGSEISKLNSNGILTSVNTTVTWQCANTVITNMDIGCLPDPSGTGTSNNVLVVQQTAKVPTWIGPLFGMPTFNIQDTAAAAMNGGAYRPYNIAVVLDTTDSMNGADDGKNDTSSCSTQINCAKSGFATLLSYLYPCQSSGTCSTSSTPVDNVSLFVFPGVTSGTEADDTTCTTSSPTTQPYTFSTNTAPTVNSSASNMAMQPSTINYQLVSFENGFKTQDQGTTLVSTDPLVISSGAASGCSGSGIKVVGHQGTYYAQVIYAAQAQLYNESNGTSGNGYKNALIILSDGDATANSSSQMKTADGSMLSGTGTSSSNPMNPSGCNPNTNAQCTGYHSYAYPSALGECGQAVIAAQAASAAGTTVYTIGYGSETAAGHCTTDATYSATISSSSYGANSWKAGDTPCQALGAMATNANTFYSDDANGCSAVAPSLQNMTSLAQIFTSIVNGFSTSTVIPNSWLNS